MQVRSEPGEDVQGDHGGFCVICVNCVSFFPLTLFNYKRLQGNTIVVNVVLGMFGFQFCECKM